MVIPLDAAVWQMVVWLLTTRVAVLHAVVRMVRTSQVEYAGQLATDASLRDATALSMVLTPRVGLAGISPRWPVRVRGTWVDAATTFFVPSYHCKRY
eukprot:CAMPEP_0177700642 /NCGR_PEP_ID=MMETSP0484_2-20121128/6200_1 /TAXON_ID=354590 /ORGANISM="Rhodomonas lens, Strain RHODO" /LENGTH=96 /DNA_ID=CAMNT_0019211849 /DNA_START=107 /DNA_END=397 /DNA_ORIENTATION=+